MSTTTTTSAPPPPASPELMSSLIEQIAAISADTMPFSPRAFPADFAHVVDVCEPPVVRTSKPPSGLSPVTATRGGGGGGSGGSGGGGGGSGGGSRGSGEKSGRRDTKATLGLYMSRSSVGSVASLGSCHSGRSEPSLGAAATAAAGGESARSSAESRRSSVKRPRSLLYMSSRERLRVRDEGFCRGDTICEEDVADAPRVVTSVENSRRLRINLVDGLDADHLAVPDRASSLRHASPAKKRRDKPRGTNLQARGKPEPSLQAKAKQPEVVDPDPDLDLDHSHVAQRIRQLREQKLRRESADAPDANHLDPDALDALDAPEAPDAKAHRLLGITPINPAEPSRPAPLPPRLRHTRHRSLTVNDGDDLPLPINYALALQTFDTSAPNSPLFANDPPDRLKRASSLSVGGRSAYGRRASTALMTAAATPAPATAPTHKHSSSLSDRPPTAASAANSFTLHHTKTLKKKRWSHPDLPAKAEKAHNDRIDRLEQHDRRNYPVHPASPVAEERPSSVDSIDDDVDAFLAAPRLSQTLRHPQSGRLISFSEVGDPTGFAVFVCVGMGLTRFVMAFYDELARTLKLRLITPERPGIGASHMDPTGTPLTWPDDVSLICHALHITKFSLLAHSAGAVYALATSLRMPQHIRGRVHLLAPWIPPSQMAPIGLGRHDPPTHQLPRAQRFLRALPPSLLRVANSTFLSNTSASLQRTPPRPKPRRARTDTPPPRPSLKEPRDPLLAMDQVLPSTSTLSLALSPTTASHRARAFDERLTLAIWDRATHHANPATDLIVCLETKQPIGFRYEDINRPVVITHGSKDSRVPVDNVRWLGRVMRKCEVRVLEGEQHGLMGSARVMGEVLMEIARDWEDWTAVVRMAEAC